MKYNHGVMGNGPNQLYQVNCTVGSDENSKETRITYEAYQKFMSSNLVLSVEHDPLRCYSKIFKNSRKIKKKIKNSGYIRARERVE